MEINVNNEILNTHRKESNNVISFTIDHNYYDTLVKQAEEAGMTISQYVKFKLLDNKTAKEIKIKADKSKIDTKFPRVMLRLNNDEAKQYHKVIKGIKNKSHFIVAKCLGLDEYKSDYVMLIQKLTKYEWHTIDDNIRCHKGF